MSDEREPYLPSMTVTRKLQYCAIRRHLISTVWFMPQSHNGRIFGNLAERPGNIRRREDRVVDPGYPEPCFRKKRGLIAQYVYALGGEQPLHARRVVGIVMITKDRQCAKWEAPCVVADDACGVGEVSR